MMATAGILTLCIMFIFIGCFVLGLGFYELSVSHTITSVFISAMIILAGISLIVYTGLKMTE
jgi:hypothetical protein